MQENIPFPDIGKNIVLIHKGRVGLRGVSGSFQVVETVYAVHLHKECQIQGTVDGENIPGMDIQFFFQALKQPFVRVLLDLQADRLAPAAFL